MRHSCGVAVNGPLATFVDSFWADLAAQGYTPLSAANQLRMMAHLSRWLEAEGLDASGLNAERVEQFLVARRSAGYTCWRAQRGMAALLGHLRGIGVSPEPVPVAPASATDVLLAEYVGYLCSERGLAASTVERYEAVARSFLWASRAEGDQDVARLSARDVTRFMTGQCRGRSTAFAKHTVTDLRAFLRFLHLSGRTQFSLAPAVPAVAGWRGSSLPRALAPAQVAALLSSSDRTTAVGRRDFAVLVLLARLGLRAVEVAQLRLEDFDWSRGDVLVRGKANRLERLPVPADVGDAVAAYLRSGRPQSELPELFLRARAPQGALGQGGVKALVRGAARRAGLGPVGPHALRHSVATDMLRNGVPISDIAQVLRHASTLTTAIYVKVDRDALRLLAEPWPGARP
ncbi:MAG TPA: site-specific integrase [Acidimicrobiales bacterium]|nr:site-specific integrase [Acidimicrobiales bacterium]